MSSLFNRLAALIAFTGLLALTAACGPSTIAVMDGIEIDQDAEIVDTELNREVLKVVTDYHDAMVKRDAATLEFLISEEYYENGGSAGRTDDDYGRKGMTDAFRRLNDAVKHLRLSIVVKDLRVEGDRAQVFYEYSWNYLYQVGEVPRWEAGRDVNRMDLVNFEGLWKITRGL